MEEGDYEKKICKENKNIFIKNGDKEELKDNYIIIKDGEKQIIKNKINDKIKSDKNSPEKKINDSNEKINNSYQNLNNKNIKESYIGKIQNLFKEPIEKEAKNNSLNYEEENEIEEEEENYKLLVYYQKI